MWTFKRLVLTNFRSFVSQVFVFKVGETYLIQGENLTDPGFKSNGAGKSSIGEALRYVLGLPVNTPTLTDLIHFNASSCSVTLEMENTKSREVVEINRATPRKGSSTLSIKVNGEDQKSKFATILDGDRFIISKLGISKEDLLNYYILSKEKFVSFLLSSDNDKKDLINRFSKANLTDGIDVLIEGDLKPLRDNLVELTAELGKLTGKLDTYNEEIRELNAEKERAGSVLIDEINGLISDNRLGIVRLQAFKVNWEKRKVTLEQHIAAIEKYNRSTLTSISEVKAERERIKKKNEANNSELKEYMKMVAELESLLSGVVTCPNCSYQFNPLEVVDIDETNVLLQDAMLTVDSIKERIKVEESDIEALNVREKLYSNEIVFNSSKIDRVRGIIKNLILMVDGVERDIAIKENDIIYLESQIELVNQSGKGERINQLQQKVKGVEKDIALKEDEIAIKNDEIYKLSQWVNRFKDFRSYLANKSLFSIQGYANMYLKKMGTNLEIVFEGFKANKDGSVREKITPVILRNGVIEGSGSFKIYSSGERCRIELAPILACQYLINASSPSGGLDCLMVDEITEGLDSLGIERLATSIQQLGITCYIISHTKYDSVFKNIITVRKVAGVSEIV